MSSGSGHDSPAPSARCSVSRTVERAMQSRRDLSCAETDEDFSRIISRAWRIVIRSAGIDRSPGLPKERPDQANGGDRHCTKLPGRDHSVTRGAGSSRFRGRHQSESAITTRLAKTAPKTPPTPRRRPASSPSCWHPNIRPAPPARRSAWRAVSPQLSWGKTKPNP